MLGSLSKLYGKVIARRNKRFDEGRVPTVKVTVPVISVGNISVGGTGKSPVVQMIVRLLQQRGYKPAIVMRGYKRSTRGRLVVHDGTSMLANAREAGDEAAMHARKLNVPVVVDESKVDAAVFAAGFLDCDVIVVDDGFQHRSLHRDLDVVLVDAATITDQRLLPAGRLREPLESLNRADVVLLTDMSVHQSDLPLGKDTVVCRLKVQAECVNNKNNKVIALSAIANPQRFTKTLEQCGFEVVEHMAFKDHYSYQKADITRVIERAHNLNAVVVTTEKDDVKLNPAHKMFADASVVYLVQPITASIVEGASEFEHLLDRKLNEDRN